MNTNNAEIVVNQLCEWDFDGDIYSTSCGHTFYLYDESATDVGFKFCPFCGKTLVESDAEDDDEDGEGED